MTVNFYRYDPTGRIVSNGSCPDSMLHLQEREGLTLATGDATWKTHYVVNGEPVQFPPKPSQHHQFDFTSKQWVVNLDAAWASVRSERQAKLQASDWSTLPDVPLTAEQKAQWVAYRQALRDVTNQPDPLNIVWPVAPT